ncbi:MAG: hypothetical protein ACYDAK_12910 [Candidatus Limnocylindrales bacterium]
MNLSNFYVQVPGPLADNGMPTGMVWISAADAEAGYNYTDPNTGSTSTIPTLTFYSSVPAGGVGLTFLNTVEEQTLNLWGSLYVGSDGNYYANVGPPGGNNPLQQIGGANAASGITAAQIPQLISSANLREQQDAAAQAANFAQSMEIGFAIAGGIAAAGWMTAADVAAPATASAATTTATTAGDALTVATGGAVPSGMTLVNGMLVPNSILAQGAVGSSMDLAANAAAASATASASVMSATDIAAINAAASWISPADLPKPPLASGGSTSPTSLVNSANAALKTATGGLVSTVPQAAGVLAAAIRLITGKGPLPASNINPATGLPYGVASTPSNAQTLQGMLPVLAIGAVAIVLLNRR